MEERRLKIFSEFRKGDPDNRVREFVLSTGAKDRHGTIIPAGSWDLTRFSGTAFYQHASDTIDPDLALGPARVYQEGDKVIMAIDFEPADLNPLADKVLRKIDNGTLRNASAGFIPYEARRGDAKRGEDDTAVYLTKNELLEGSVVNIPSNYQAQVRKADEDFETVVKAVEENDCRIEPSKPNHKHKAKLRRAQLARIKSKF